jgi:hypothetical protein
VREELTSDETAFSAALTGLFVTNGWSALWDGVRLANETSRWPHRSWTLLAVTVSDSVPTAPIVPSWPSRNGVDNNSVTSMTRATREMASIPPSTT